MSHYSLLVLIDREDGNTDVGIYAAVERLLAPYDSALEVEPYEEDCWECAEQEPDPKCAECCGTGRCTVTFNPDAKWDWWQQGGRFTGALVTDYDPRKDPANLEPCPYCAALKKRLEQERCGRCKGTGISVKEELRPFERDILPAFQVRPDVLVWAVLTPDGDWKDQSEFRFYPELWEREVRAALAAHADCLAVLIDYHM